MKKTVILIFGLLLINTIFSQERVIKITNEISKKEIVIKENKRVRVQTVDGRKISGRFEIVDNNIILLKGEQIHLSDIEAIKRNSLLLSIFTSGVLIYGGAITAGIGTIIGVFADTSGLFLIIPAAAMIYAGIKSPNIQKNYKTNKNWTFEFVTNSQ